MCKDTLLGSQTGAVVNGDYNRTIETHGVPFRDVMDGIVAFIRREGTEPAIIIAHGAMYMTFQFH